MNGGVWLSIVEGSDIDIYKYVRRFQSAIPSIIESGTPIPTEVYIVQVGTDLNIDKIWTFHFTDLYSIPMVGANLKIEQIGGTVGGTGNIIPVGSILNITEIGGDEPEDDFEFGNCVSVGTDLNIEIYYIDTEGIEPPEGNYVGIAQNYEVILL